MYAGGDILLSIIGRGAWECSCGPVPGTLEVRTAHVPGYPWRKSAALTNARDRMIPWLDNKLCVLTIAAWCASLSPIYTRSSTTRGPPVHTAYGGAIVIGHSSRFLGRSLASGQHRAILSRCRVRSRSRFKKKPFDERPRHRLNDVLLFYLGEATPS